MIGMLYVDGDADIAVELGMKEMEQAALLTE